MHTCSVASLWLYEPQSVLPTRLLCPWDFCSKNTGVDFCAFLQGIFQTQGSNTCLLHCRWILYHWATGEAQGVSLLLSHVWLFVTPNGTPLQYSCLENPMDGGDWKAAVHGVAEGRTRLSDFTFTFHFHALEKKMAPHSSTLAWTIPGTGEPGGLPSIGSHWVGHDWSDLAAAAAYLQHMRLLCPSPSLELSQSHVHWVGDAIQPSHPLSSPSPPAFSLSQYQSLFQLSQLFTSGDQSVGASASVSVLPMNIQDWFPLGLTGLISLQSKGLSWIFSNTTVQKHQFSSGPTLASVLDYLKNHSFDYMGLCQQNNAFAF